MRRQMPFKAILVLSVALVVGIALMVMVSQRSVKAAPPSGASVEGVVKLDGTPPHQRPIDMSKEPSCAAIHKEHPAATENVVVGPDWVWR